MNNDRPPASKLRKWVMRNNESTLPGLRIVYFDVGFSKQQFFYPIRLYPDRKHWPGTGARLTGSI